MHQFKSTYNILTKQDEDEVFRKSWFETDQLCLPPSKKWDYSRELQIEDVNIWEVICEESNGFGLYASWDPYAEFYLVTKGIDDRNPIRFVNNIPYYDRKIETFYGPGAQQQAVNLAVSLGMHIWARNVWIEEDDMWLYQQPEKKIILSQFTNQ
jgi:hypothetical protein